MYFVESCGCIDRYVEGLRPTHQVGPLSSMTMMMEFFTINCGSSVELYIIMRKVEGSQRSCNCISIGKEGLRNVGELARRT